MTRNWEVKVAIQYNEDDRRKSELEPERVERRIVLLHFRKLSHNADGVSQSPSSHLSNIIPQQEIRIVFG